MSEWIEFVPRVVYYTTFADGHTPRSSSDVTYFSVDRQLLYTNFYLDFGPLNLGQTFLFSQVLNQEMERVKKVGKKLVFYSSTDGKRKANAICILSCWGILFNDMTAEEAFYPFETIATSLPTFHDATPSICFFKLTVLDCLRGLEKAVHHRFIDIATFSVDEYQHYEQVENGDLNWLSPKFIAFAGPHDVYRQTIEGYITLTPEHYIPYFSKHNVTLVIRLNEKLYDETRFTKAGIQHLDLFYPDGANPPNDLLDRFLEACETTTGAIAVHCKAGLGRTGTCIGAYLMKHYHFTAKECIGWLRLCRAGSVIGPQQQYMESIEKRMWALGESKNQDVDDSNRENHVQVSPCKTKTKSFGGNIFTKASKPTMLPARTSPQVTPLPPPSPDKTMLKASLRLNLANSFTVACTSEVSPSSSSPKTQGDNLRELKHTWSKSPTNRSPTHANLSDS